MHLVMITVKTLTDYYSRSPECVIVAVSWSVDEADSVSRCINHGLSFRWMLLPPPQQTHTQYIQAQSRARSHNSHSHRAIERAASTSRFATENAQMLR